MSSRWRWLVWSLYLGAWTIGLLWPVRPGTGVEEIDELISPYRYAIAKAAHLSAYAVLTILTGWLRVTPPRRVLLMFGVMAHATVTELAQWTMQQLDVSVRIGHLHDVAYDNLGILLGLLASWKWWMRKSEPEA